MRCPRLQILVAGIFLFFTVVATLAYLALNHMQVSPSPMTRLVSPMGRAVSPTGRAVSPTARPVSPTARHVLPTPRRGFPASRHVPPRARHVPPRSRRVPARSRRVPPRSRRVPPRSRRVPGRSRGVRRGVGVGEQAGRNLGLMLLLLYAAFLCSVRTPPPHTRDHTHVTIPT
eukprot:618554-Rhodomonas_salina.3